MSNWKEYINGNYSVRIDLDTGTKVRTTYDDEFRAAFAENMDVKICDFCDMGCLWCHEGSTKEGQFADILNERFIDTLHPYQELAIGGGDATSHPDLIPFLRKLKDMHIITNITVNQIHFERKQELIQQLVDEGLIYGLGISLVNPTEEFISLVQKYPHAVIHVVEGIVTWNEIRALAGKGLKILILGYKQLRRGNEYYQSNWPVLNEWSGSLETLIRVMIEEKMFDTISFDNLAIEHLHIRSMMSDEDWEKFYMGDDGTSTFYIDMVNRKFARSSTAPMDQRFDLLDSVDEMFEVIRNKE